MVPKDTLLVPQFCVTHNTENFVDPDLFIPERWLKKQEYHTYSYTPFLAGPRNCIG